jgi:hypothetical protein
MPDLAGMTVIAMTATVTTTAAASLFVNALINISISWHPLSAD